MRSSFKETKALDSMRFKLLRGVGLTTGDAMIGKVGMKQLQHKVSTVAKQRGVRGGVTAFHVPGTTGASGEAGGRKVVFMGNNTDQDSAVWHEVGHHLDTSEKNNTELHPIELLRREARASKGKNTPLLRNWHASYVRAARRSTPGFAKLYKSDSSLRLGESVVLRCILQESIRRNNV